MLLTTCPNCSAQFKVQPEQLNVRQGRVMCGRCRNVFNAFQSLTRVEESEAATDTPELATATTTEEPPSDPFDAIFLRDEPAPLSREFSHNDSSSDLPLQGIPPALPDIDSAESEPVADVVEQTPRPSPISLLAGDTDHSESPGHNPLLVSSAGYRQPAEKEQTRIWSTGIVFLLLGLTTQIAYAYRSAIIQSYPQLRPSFVSMCEWTGCHLSWGRDDNAIRIEASDLIETPGKAGSILLTATLVNRGTTRQDLPALELKLTDNANQVIVSRIFPPQEYLGRVPTKDESLAPNVETYVNLRIELVNQAQASGYGVRAFYN